MRVSITIRKGLKAWEIIILLLFLFLLLGQDCLSQSHIFKVVACSGFPSIIKNNGVSQKLNTGSGLVSGDRLALPEGSYIAMVHEGGSTLELNQSGVYSISELLLKVRNQGGDLSKKLSAYLISEMIEAKSSREMKNIAAVVRQTINFIDTDVPSTTLIHDSVIVFRWYKPKEVDAYFFKLISPISSTIMMKEVKDTFLLVDLQGLNLKPNECYRWYVSNPHEENLASDSGCIMIMTQKDKKAIIDTLEEFNKDLPGEDNAVKELVMALFYERHNLNINAMEAYETALKLSPGVDEYRNKYLNFLVRNGMMRKALSISNMTGQ